MEKRQFIQLFPAYLLISLLIIFSIKPHLSISSSEEQLTIKPVLSMVTIEKPNVSARPIKLEIPSLALSIVVVDGEYEEATDEWTISDENAHFALPSKNPVRPTDNILIYGHNSKNIFGQLYKLKAGDQAIVYLSNGKAMEYVLYSSEKVLPNDVSVFSYEGPPRLTLLTCTGFLNEYRALYYFI